MGSLNLPIGGFYHLTGYGFDNNTPNNPYYFISAFDKIVNKRVDINDESLPIDIRIASLPDMAISELKEPLSIPLLNNQIVLPDGEVLIEDGTPKHCIYSEGILSFNKENMYVVAGTVQNEIKDSILLKRTNVFHEQILFEEMNFEKNAILKIPWVGRF